MNCRLFLALCLFLCFCGSIPALAQAAPPPRPRLVRFSGYDWEVRAEGQGNPHHNFWSPDNVSVDGLGRLHLKITRQGDRWQCAQVSTRQSFGFGRYQFQVAGRLDRLDPNVVLGFFDYPPPTVGPDETNEIDIEYSRWGSPANPPVNFTVYPTALDLRHKTLSSPMPPGLVQTTQRFLRQADEVNFQALRGYRNDDQGEYARWTFRPDDPKRVPQQPLPILINLWLTHANSPQDGREVEIIVKSFSFTPIR